MVEEPNPTKIFVAKWAHKLSSNLKAIALTRTPSKAYILWRYILLSLVHLYFHRLAWILVMVILVRYGWLDVEGIMISHDRVIKLRC